MIIVVTADGKCIYTSSLVHLYNIHHFIIEPLSVFTLFRNFSRISFSWTGLQKDVRIESWTFLPKPLSYNHLLQSTGRRSPKSVPIVCFFLNPELVSEPKHQSTSKPFHTLQACVGAGMSGSHKTNLSQGKMNSKVNEFVQTYSTHSVYISSSLQICQHFTGKYSEWIHGKVTTSDIILTIIPIFL